jgi:hypothetical protein
VTVLAAVLRAAGFGALVTAGWLVHPVAGLVVLAGSCFALERLAAREPGLRR